MNPSVPDLTSALRAAWCAATSIWDQHWPPDNPARGQCIASSLVVQDFYGGDIVRFAVKGKGISENHYCNILSDGTLLDTTSSQYTVAVSVRPHPVQLGHFSSMRERCLADEETRRQYMLLKQRTVVMLQSSFLGRSA